ncbi:recombinase family protein [Paenibacillus xerothermodurans]|uniref:Recombinase family protein n=1 Tax=Paenibacillus xerothermodurans TaxID=1977292 RepID=A0A2W1NUI5_PAEXE|nr:recombinase family protein [Paenibacillus xerothermodurans]PZE21416.1 recombinase family protein [Paenibacillus xerothermodurans]
MQPGKMKCAVYARVSTDQQGDSIENQVSQCREFITRLGGDYDHVDIQVYRDEAVSGYYTSVFERASMKRAIHDAKAGLFKLLVFKEVSRVGRDKQENPAIIGMFEQYGVRVIAINDNYDSLNKDNITFDILSVLSEQESKKISARVSSARKQKARRGQWNGEPPIGYKVDKLTKKLVADPELQHIPRLIFDLYVNHGLGTFKVAQHLNQLGIQTRHGNLWSRESVNKILRNAAYVGHVVYGTRRNQLKRQYDDSGKMTKRKVQIKLSPAEWQIVQAAHEALIDEQLFRRAQAILSARGRNSAPKRAAHPLTGILFCGLCRAGMVCQKRSSAGKTYRYYICKTYHKYGRAACPQANSNAEELEDAILNACRNKLLAFPEERIVMTISMQKEKQRMEQELHLLQEKVKKWSQDQLDIFQQRDLFPNSVYEQQMRSIKRSIQSAEMRLAQLWRQLEACGATHDAASELRPLVVKFKRLELDELCQKRVLFHELITRVDLTGGQVHIHYTYDFTK